MRAGLVAVAVLAAVTAVGCDDGTGVRVVGGTPPPTPYSGPPHVPVKSPDGHSTRVLRVASGAAGRALECDGEIFEGGGPDGWGRAEGGDTPEAGPNLCFGMFRPARPDHGYRVERGEADRVLYSFDVEGRTELAVGVAKDQKGRPGWGPETNASRDPAELPATFAAAQGGGGLDGPRRQPGTGQPAQRLDRPGTPRPAVGPLPRTGPPHVRP
ncbi:hypothetical protein J2Z21_003115 [Streptomyces griseochromogenes]|uniref:Lipoprotein n=1 Tax=Streptomyces griseochromogenes TaxID=68214 RepID=A0ABS4LSD9_9ACTN|nr:hypothetical protein [Streptomyces griseochromogenes]MBP2050179.1 hypothetical protein [Streptomyces griseochromogenes]